MNRNWLWAVTIAGTMMAGSAFAAGQYGEGSAGVSGQQSGQGAMQSSAGALSSDSDAVRQAQQALNQQGYDVGPIDGIHGPMTQGALREFQQDQNLQATGQLDQETASALGLEVSEFAAGEFEDGSQSPSGGATQPGMSPDSGIGGGMDSGSPEMGGGQMEDRGGM